MTTLLVLAALVLAPLVVPGCQVLPTRDPGREPAALHGTAWRAVAVAGEPSVAGAIPTIRFDGARLIGSTGCNDFGAGFGRLGDRFELGEFQITERACDGAVGDQERRFLDALTAANRIDLGFDRLRLLGPGGVLEFIAE